MFTYLLTGLSVSEVFPSELLDSGWVGVYEWVAGCVRVCCAVFVHGSDDCVCVCVCVGVCVYIMGGFVCVCVVCVC